MDPVPVSLLAFPLIHQACAPFPPRVACAAKAQAASARLAWWPRAEAWTGTAARSARGTDGGGGGGGGGAATWATARCSTSASATTELPRRPAARALCCWRPAEGGGCGAPSVLRWQGSSGRRRRLCRLLAAATPPPPLFRASPSPCLFRPAACRRPASCRAGPPKRPRRAGAAGAGHRLAGWCYGAAPAVDARRARAAGQRRSR